MGAERYDSAIHLLSIRFSRSRHIYLCSSRDGVLADASPKITLVLDLGKRKPTHLFGKQNRLVRLWKEHSAKEGAGTRKDHHDPEDPAPPKMTHSNTTEKAVRYLCDVGPYQHLLASDNRSQYWPQEYIHREYACRDATSAWVPYVGDYAAAAREWRTGKESGKEPRDDDRCHILRQSLAKMK